MAFGCSISGRVKPVEVIRLAEACLEAGADIVGVADTVGYAAPAQVQEIVSEIRKLVKEFPLIIHLHDTRGMAIANASAALDSGANVIDGSLGGLGGCPFAPGATGNVVTEELVYLCERMGFETGIDLEALLLVREMAEAAMPKEIFMVPFTEQEHRKHALESCLVNQMEINLRIQEMTMRTLFKT